MISLMIFSDDVFVRIVVCALGFSGFLVARHIHTHKKPEQTPLVCPMKFDCNAVVHSDYSKFLGVHLEIFGMIYYALITIIYFILIFSPDILHVIFSGALVLGSLTAFLFSLYLIGVQVFVLKKGCFWCYISATICILIFTLNIFAYDFVSIIQKLIQ